MEDLTIVPMLRVGMPLWTLCVLFVFAALCVALCVVSAIAEKALSSICSDYGQGMTGCSSTYLTQSVQNGMPTQSIGTIVS
ncbi:hypothetical protein RYA05_14765 [Pseudomonas syringae pv. actinidiae]|uniref:Uncharacterized conserved protein YurZ n=4 Tax=Pseudomonas syringae TaxID=317 RepID=A0A2V0QIS9_PSESF|nr:hypothetical protein [Pseudomonas syringae]AKT32239.1 hypothetical protein IYO_022480 [Pseudomonas syringae pv. actinidiae ICMP 18884]AOE58583.1 hypothetical protein NZ708_22460 [Pseudomonas syringae pv. actinidiae ICMP 18708]AQL39385.1 hypothetical protein JN853_25110 [Pseudomonas syringae pv. actinidiae ICMP 9853]AYL82756.1 hypothetical protein CN228_25215 [Pseudomonas syringae pv. actinidiae str. Shaanxi_M228]EGH64287.1 hypothetical protein PSYAC_05165 [Pseudomonas syringae pv. actinidia